MGQVLGWVREALPLIDHFAHAAGVPGFAMLRDMSTTEFREIAEVKVRTFIGDRCCMIISRHPYALHVYVCPCSCRQQ